MYCMEDGGSRTPEMLTPWGGPEGRSEDIDYIFQYICKIFTGAESYIQGR